MQEKLLLVFQPQGLCHTLLPRHNMLEFSECQLGPWPAAEGWVGTEA